MKVHDNYQCVMQASSKRAIVLAQWHEIIANGCSIGFIHGKGASNCPWMFNEASPTPWCHVVVHFEVKMNHFDQVQEDHRDPARS